MVNRVAPKQSQSKVRQWTFLGLSRNGAYVYALTAEKRRKHGQPISQFDAQIVAIATRNVADFEACGLEILNPWGS